MRFEKADASKAAREAEAEREARKAKELAAASATLKSLPSILGRARIVDAPAAALFWGVSLPHWRRLYRLGRVPAPVRVGERKLGWPIGDLADGLAQRSRVNAAAWER